MNSAELVNLILKTFQNRVKFKEITSSQYNRSFVSVEFTWGQNDYLATCTKQDRHVVVYRRHEAMEKNDSFRSYVEGRLNGLTRNDAGELVKP